MINKLIGSKSFRLSLKDKREGDFMKTRKLICFFVVARNCFFVDALKFVLLLTTANDRKVNYPPWPIYSIPSFFPNNS